MNLVFARHSNDERVRLFRVCDGETLKHGQKIIVRTRRGAAEAIVSGDSFETTDGTANIIAMKCGSYMTMPFRERHQREMKQGWCFRNRV